MMFGARTRLAWIVLWLVVFRPGNCGIAFAEIPAPTDAPQPLSPAEAVKTFRVPEGYRLELVAAEPLVREPSGVCWDARGRMYVSELHGYNLDGQYDIEELNKTGQLDREVRRIRANKEAERKALQQTYGTIKLLADTNGDGVMDQATVFADRLPPCYGICPARDGIIAVGAPSILFLADRDGDGVAEVRETLYTGFATGALERGINCPQWGLDDWIHVGAGHGGGTITGPNLTAPVPQPNTNFRIKADGTAIEPTIGRTGTIGFAFTARGEQFVIATNSPGIFVAPLPWRYLARNPDYAPGSLSETVGDRRTYPTSQPHPWRTRRASDPGFAKFYTDRYGVGESAPNGYFTSACSPLVYQGCALSGLRGRLLACEPAQNMIHRAEIHRDGTLLDLRRVASEKQSEFLTSTDTWFNPIALAHGPDDSVYVVDFYREIIEDYSAIPRYLQQQYELKNGNDRGRLWRLTHRDAPAAAPADLSNLSAAQLVEELASGNFWRRQTARRLLLERGTIDVVPQIGALAARTELPAGAINALHALSALDALQPEVLLPALAANDAGVRIQAMQLCEPWLDRDPRILDAVLALVDDDDASVVLQVALSLGESRDPRAISSLARIARERGDIRWMDAAVVSSTTGRAGDLLTELLKSPDRLAAARRLIEPLSTTIAARRNAAELSHALVAFASLQDDELRQSCFRGLRAGLSQPVRVALTEPAATALTVATAHDDVKTAAIARELLRLLRLESAEARTARIAGALQTVGDIQLANDARLAAVNEIAAEDDPAVSKGLLNSLGNGTPQIREAILNAMFSRNDRMPAILAGIEEGILPASALSAVQRAALLDHADVQLRQRAQRQFASLTANHEQTLARYVAALETDRNPTQGAKLFREKCATCHQAHGEGVAVGPDLSAESKRAEETILRDIVAPGSTIAAGYVTYLVRTTDGRVFTGLMSNESASGITLKQAEGKTQTVLRKDIEEIRASAASLMPDDLTKSLSPQDAADLLAWLRTPPSKVALIDEDPAIVDALNEGAGEITLVTTDAARGQHAWLLKAPQRYAAQIPGWEYQIRENPAPGEFRYLRFAWKSAGATGIMLELADQGTWPDATIARQRYFAGVNTTGWQAIEITPNCPDKWTIVTRDLWKDFGDMTLTGIAPTACEGAALFDQIELLRELDK